LVKDGRVVYSSQSVSDVTEGFDVTIPESVGAGHFEIYLDIPHGSNRLRRLEIRNPSPGQRGGGTERSMKTKVRNPPEALRSAAPAE